MKTRTELKAGRDINDCGQELAWWQRQANLMKQFVNNPSSIPPAGLWFPTGTATQLPEYPGTAGKDMSGICG
jgi:hypothetical protein